MKKIYIILALVFLTLITKANIRQDLKSYGLNVSEDFHVIFVNINMSSKSNGSVIYTIYNHIQNQAKSKEVIFIFQQENYNYKYFVKYTKEILKITPFPSKTAKICINDGIYNKYKRNGWYSEYLYYTGGSVFYQTSAKFINLPKVSELPKTAIKVEFKNKILLDSTYLHTRRDLFCQFRNSILQLSDNNYRLCLIDSSGKAFNCVKIPEIENAISIYKRKINPDTVAIRIAEEYKNEYKKINRPEVSPETFFASSNFIYIPVSVAVFEKRKFTRSYSGGGNFKKEFKKGIIDDNIYGFIYKLDSNLNPVSLINLTSPLLKLYDDSDLSFLDIYSNNDSIFYIFHEYNDEVKEKWYSKKVISTFKLNTNNELEYLKSLNIPPEEKAKYLNIAHITTPFKDDYILSRGKNLYSLNDSKKVAELSGLRENIGRAETYPKYVNDTIEYNLDYEVLAVNKIGESNLCVIYKNFRTVIMEVFDENFKSIQISRLGITDDNQVGGYLSYNNNLVQLKFSNGNAYLLFFELINLTQKGYE
jgi:hypothetical protein